ncbi:Hypothetical protein EAG7_05222 [Klebsiella aerogenes]|nr:Hypothetical protein EAG7_05222 [Klebsiella aerogenes]CCG33719.1 hypothetical protein [Klebsiella aerogenes EA1509E]
MPFYQHLMLYVKNGFYSDYVNLNSLSQSYWHSPRRAMIL